MGPGGAAMLSRGEGSVSNAQVSWSSGGKLGWFGAGHSACRRCKAPHSLAE